MVELSKLVSRRQKYVILDIRVTELASTGQILDATIYLSQVAEDAAGTERWIQLVFAWAGKTFELEIAESDRVYDLKAALHSLTEVPPERQKILGLVKGKLPPDQARVLVRNIPFVCMADSARQCRLEACPGQEIQSRWNTAGKRNQGSFAFVTLV